MDAFNEFIRNKRMALLLERPSACHRLRFLMKMRKRNIRDFTLDIAHIARGAAAAIFLFSTIAPALVSENKPEPVIDTINGVAADAAFYKPTKRRRMNLTPSQLQQASFNLKQLGFEEEGDEYDVQNPKISTIFL